MVALLGVEVENLNGLDVVSDVIGLAALEVVAESHVLRFGCRHENQLSVVADLAVHQEVPRGRVRAVFDFARDAGLVHLSVFVVDASVVAPGTDLVVDVVLGVVCDDRSVPSK